MGLSKCHSGLTPFLLFCFSAFFFPFLFWLLNRQYSLLVILNKIYYYRYMQENIMQTAEKLSITLPAEMVRIIREKVGAGIYSSNSEVIREALRGWMEREQRLATLDAAIARGVADADAGRTQEIETMREELRNRFES
jgi:antitoxin ParD1/3/4